MKSPWEAYWLIISDECVISWYVRPADFAKRETGEELALSVFHERAYKITLNVDRKNGVVR